MNEEHFRDLCKEMVKGQLMTRGIADTRVLDAMRKVPRHKFLPKNLENSAYDDCALPIGEGQTISQPYMVALMTELLGFSGGEKVLEIGAGSGYQAAILAEIAGKVITIEKVPELADRARKKLEELGYKNVNVIVGDGTEGMPSEAPFDGIIVTAAAPSIPQPLVDQLADGGRLVIPVGDQYLQTLKIVSKKGKKIQVEDSIGCVFVPLLGKYGWSEKLSP